MPNASPIGHVHFMLFVSVSFTLVANASSRGFQWNMDYICVFSLFMKDPLLY